MYNDERGKASVNKSIEVANLTCEEKPNFTKYSNWA
jgi:hypothetical protein